MKIKSHLIFPAVFAAGVGAALAGCKSSSKEGTAAAGQEPADLTAVTFNADSAFADIEAQCAFGARVPGSAAHTACGDYIIGRLRACGLTVEEQKATFRLWDGTSVSGRNIIGRYNPAATDRVVIAAHWDSRPWADADPDSALHRTPVMAANDGASGVAVIIELARLMAELKPAVGVDFVCFDAEDCGAPYWGTPDPEGRDWCLGSQYWAGQAAAAGYTARYGILLDMVGGKDARFCREGFSLRYAERCVNRLWATAAAVGASSLFADTEGGYATDDHVPMNEIAGIPTIDVVPFIAGSGHSFGKTWHTTHDVPENISRETLRLVGQTLLQMLSEEQ